MPLAESYPAHVTVSQLAEFLGLSVAYIREMCAAGTVTARMDRFRRYVIDAAELKRLGCPPFEPVDLAPADDASAP